jgi:hypothetical protein
VPLNAPSSIFYVDVTDPSVIAGVITVVDKIGPTGARGATGATGAPTSATYTPVLTATGLVGSASTYGTYIRYGDVVTFSARIALTSISNFGTGQYSITLPFLSAAITTPVINGIIDVAGSQGGAIYRITAVTTEGGAVAKLFVDNAVGLMASVTGTSPVTLTTSSIIYITGSFIAVTA